MLIEFVLGKRETMMQIWLLTVTVMTCELFIMNVNSVDSFGISIFRSMKLACIIFHYHGASFNVFLFL